MEEGAREDVGDLVGGELASGALPEVRSVRHLDVTEDELVQLLPSSLLTTPPQNSGGPASEKVWRASSAVHQPALLPEKKG